MFGGLPTSAEIKTDADDLVAEGEGAIQGPFRIRFVEVTEEAHDQARADAKFAFGVADGAMQPADHGCKGDAARSVTLRVEEHLDVADIVSMGPLQIGECQVVKVLLGDEHRHAPIVEVEKVLEVTELIGLPQRFNEFIGQLDSIPPRQCEHHLGLEAAFDVNMQLAFRQSRNQRFCVVHLHLPQAVAVGQ